MRTRGQLTVGILSDLPILQAKAGAQVSEEIIKEAKRRWEREPEQYVPDEIKELAENEWLLHLFFDRDNKTKIPSWSFASMRKMAHQGYDLIKEETLKRINLDFDWKRELAQPETQMAGQVISGINPNHITLGSRAIRDIDTFHEVRRLFEQWRQTNPGVLKTLDDWKQWSSYRQRGLLRSAGKISGRGSLVDQAKREFLRQYTNKEEGYPGTGYRDLADWLTSHGYETSVDAIKNAKRSRKSNLDWLRVDDEEVKCLLDLIKRYPT